jgi:hypothetical protein
VDSPVRVPERELPVQEKVEDRAGAIGRRQSQQVKDAQEADQRVEERPVGQRGDDADAQVPGELATAF